VATLNETVDLLGRCLGTVLLEQEGRKFFDLEERIRLETKRLREAQADTSPMQRELAAVSVDDAEKLVRAFSTYFLLINLAEEHARVHRVLEPGTGQRREGFEQALTALKAEGHDAGSARQLISGLDLGLTFTAHPTEMRRRSVRAHLEQISELLESAEPSEPITAHVEALWSTPWLKARHPTVRDEVNSGLAYLDVIASVLPRLERDLEARFEQVFGAKAALRLPLSLHSWMGGDRDGNPNVTPKATEETFALHLERATQALRARLDEAYARLSQADGAEPGDAASGASLETPARPAAAKLHVPAQPRQESEPFRGRLRELEAAVNERRAEDVERGVEALLPLIREKGQARTADVLARPLSVQARIFGLHLASLDLREHSSLTGAAVAELLTRAGVEGYAELPEAKKVEVLRNELATKRPLLAVGEEAPESVEKVVAPLRAARAAGPRAFGRYVVSMSEQPSDLLEVLVLAREAGVDAQPVPLFETLEDLDRAPQVMRAVLELPEYRARLGERTQEVMIGYSDSNKDGGFVAANWALHEAQRRLAKVFADAKVRYRFFHGRGTSVGRGGGPMARALLGQPAGTVGAGMRITEQGEALQDKYSHPALAYRNLEQALYGLIAAAGRPARELDATWVDAMARAAKASSSEYRALVHDPRFLPFFEAVTPIREISRLRIASRPVRRPGPSKLSNLRAIPWVMSWTQCRAVLPGWYGLDAGLDAIGPELARALYRDWPFFRSMLDNAQMALAKSDLLVFRAYRQLAEDDALGRQLEERFRRCVERVCEVVEGELLANEPRLQRSIALRNPYIEPIHRLQVELLRKARTLPDGEDLPPQLERALLMSLHGIAAGMRNTG